MQRDIRVAVYDGKMHPVDNKISFKIAGLQAFRRSPFSRLTRRYWNRFIMWGTLSDSLGAVMGDLQNRRAIVEEHRQWRTFQKWLPKCRSQKWKDDIRFVQSHKGRAKFKMSFQAYEAVPFDLQAETIDEYTKHAKEEYT